ncbi:predicted protein [Chaetoceros tenuissimus]|uniref:Uncharacterized protein n=1 Tax=Chaetoceros tenuissimus TaxID=426638 RepID=A0AAD3CEA7_9STRA|nr:predicted protein [Chaetoceros tenuissimus]
MNKERTSAQTLRSMYQETAALFLQSCASSTQKKKENAKQSCEALIARQLILNVMHEADYRADRDDSKCISSNETFIETSQEINIVRSGGNKETVASDVADQEAAKISNLYQSQRNALDQKSMHISISEFSKSLADSMFTNKRDMIRHDFYCKGCGHNLLPSPFAKDVKDSNVCNNAQIRLKTANRGKTRRRRASRQAAKKHTFENLVLQKGKGGGRAFAKGGIKNNNTFTTSTGHGRAVASVMDTETALRKRQASIRVHDGGCKNYISYKCICGTEQKFKGIKPSNFKMKMDNQDEIKNLGSNNSSKAYAASTKRKYTDDTSKNEGDDFIRLSSTPDKKQSIDIPKKKLKPLEKGPKKKKAKGKQKKSGLSDFLSSLND